MLGFADKWNLLDAPSDRQFESLDCGRKHSCALEADGTPHCWGDDTDERASPPEDKTFIAISAGYAHTCALETDGTPVCWGNSEHGRATPPAVEESTPVSPRHLLLALLGLMAVPLARTLVLGVLSSVVTRAGGWR